MFNYIWPMGLIIISNIFYQVCTKSVPSDMDPFASLTITYLIGAAFSFIMYFALNRNANLIQEYGKLNWAPLVLGVAIVGLEVGYIFVFKAGWGVSVAQIVQAAVVAVVMIFVGYLFYKEALSWNKIVGIIVCLAGLGLINLK